MVACVAVLVRQRWKRRRRPCRHRSTDLAKWATPAATILDRRCCAAFLSGRPAELTPRDPARTSTSGAAPDAPMGIEPSGTPRPSGRRRTAPCPMIIPIVRWLQPARRSAHLTPARQRACPIALCGTRAATSRALPWSARQPANLAWSQRFEQTFLGITLARCSVRARGGNGHRPRAGCARRRDAGARGAQAGSRDDRRAAGSRRACRRRHLRTTFSLPAARVAGAASLRCRRPPAGAPVAHRPQCIAGPGAAAERRARLRSERCRSRSHRPGR